MQNIRDSVKIIKSNAKKIKTHNTRKKEKSN